MATNLRIKSLAVATNSSSHTFDFAAPITYVTGSVGMAKSTLIMLIKHALGGSAALTPAVVEHVTHVDLRIQVGASPLILRRRIGTEAGAVEVIEPGSGIVEHTWAVSPTPADGPSVSRFLLELLGVPVERVPTTKAGINARTVALTFNDIFRYCYLQAKEIDRSVVGHLDTYNNPKRIAAFELMFGLTDPDLLELKRRRGVERDQANQIEKDAAAVERFIVDAGVIDSDGLRARRLELLQMLRAAEDRLQAARDEVDAVTAVERDRRTALSTSIAAAKNLRDDADLMGITARGREAALAQLHLEFTKAERLRSAVGLLAPFEFSTCPRCIQQLEEREVGEANCRLCCQPIEQVELSDSNLSDENAARMRSQIAETEELLAADTIQLEQYNSMVRRADAELEALGREYDQATAQGVSPRIEVVAQLSQQAEAHRHDIREADRQTTMWRRLEQLRAEMTGHRKVERALAVDIKEREKVLRSRGAQVSDISAAFSEEVGRIGIQTDGVPRIDSTTFLPFVGDTAFEGLQASGGGASTALNIAYHLTLLTQALDNPDFLLPNLLIVDSPRKAIGNSESDRALGRSIYSRLVTLAQTYQNKIQLIVADNDVPLDIVGPSPMIELTSQRSTVPGVANTGVGRGKRVEDM